MDVLQQANNAAKSNVSKASGINWLKRHLGDGFRFHEIKSRCPDPLHIDSTLVL